MALIKCPECKKKISNQCENCPNCGYPIKANISTVGTDASEITDLPKDNATKPLFIKWWFWIVFGVVLAALVLGTVLYINRDTKPRFDKDGNPVFVELTNEVYTNASKYKGYHINIKGKVFQVIGDNGENKGIQVWLDPETCEQNLMIYYSTDIEVKQGDYISCTGYIDSVTKYKNAYDAELQVPLVFSTDLKKSTYIDVMAPTLEEILPENLKKESYGYTVSIDKVEFSERETRVYVSATNNGKSKLCVGDFVIIQSGQQYKSTTNYDADYAELPHEIYKGATISGIVTFPKMSSQDFELTIDLYSDDYDEELDKFTFAITKNPITPPESGPVNRNQEAVAEAVRLAELAFPTNRHFIKQVLLNPSLAEGFDAFTEAEAEYAIQNANIDWKEHALYLAQGIIEGCVNFVPTQADLSSSLKWCDIHVENDSRGFTDEEIQYAIDNCGIN